LVALKHQIPLLDLRPQNEPLRAEILAALEQVIDSQRFILGDDVRLFEEEIAAYLGVPHTVGCASGSDALYLALLAVGIGPGAAVLTSPFSFFATAGMVARTGAAPVFADIEPASFNLDPAAVERQARAHPNIKAIIPVHLYGGCADMDPLSEIAGRHGWTVIEDAAQSVGATYKNRRAMDLGAIGCLSFFPSKNLGAFGDAGLLATRDSALAKKLAALRVHGALEKYRHEWVGINSRIDTLQAAVLRVKLRYLDDWTRAREANAALYNSLLATSSAPVIAPRMESYQTRHAFNQYVIRCQQRDELKAYLAAEGIGTEIYYPLPLHLQPCFRNLGGKPGDLPESEKAAGEVLALPIHSGLTRDDITAVCDRISAFYSRS
jgi:dTDP-4-amino-4,6-dideoxygalactose transaminase